MERYWKAKEEVEQIPGWKGAMREMADRSPILSIQMYLGPQPKAKATCGKKSLLLHTRLSYLLPLLPIVKRASSHPAQGQKRRERKRWKQGQVRRKRLNLNEKEEAARERAQERGKKMKTNDSQTCCL